MTYTQLQRWHNGIKIVGKYFNDFFYKNWQVATKDLLRREYCIINFTIFYMSISEEIRSQCIVENSYRMTKKLFHKKKFIASLLMKFQTMSELFVVKIPFCYSKLFSRRWSAAEAKVWKFSNKKLQSHSPFWNKKRGLFKHKCQLSRPKQSIRSLAFWRENVSICTLLQSDLK